ncbi:CTLH/CRA C-terminal to lish motif domain-containing protein [Talaromyces proteolyticus]|uniref:Protein FYV10 n=1 Tax=Talaromyces proteolyticus TaxID=1131652 RepID=A0AAD4PX82_9EURO|nr:CTLH/CRA C-terminal to lish motif domain-containing protein [Talaromyces proteolyticus]KAH8696109.1 CTLH/CRA C-terminal to lish motif domain-containing protein [Talaromyces proteolyticus]
MASTNVMSPTSSSTTPTWHQFERRVDEVKASKADINCLVMDYLVTNGYPAAAKRFAVEANIQPKADIGSIEERVEIRSAIHSGDIQTAIEKINELNPQILDEDPSLHFSLLRLQLVELIRKCTSTPNGDITPALDFATSRLAPRAPTNPQFLEDLERTLALLIFPAENLTVPLANLLHPDLRKDIATRVNEAILESQGARKEARLRNLVKLRAWAEQKARDTKQAIPDHLDIGLHSDKSTANAQHRPSQNGSSDDAVMANDGSIDPMIA